MNYLYPHKDAEFVLEHIVNFDGLCETSNLSDVNLDLASIILEEAGKFSKSFIAPTNVTGDKKGITIDENGVQETEGFKEAYLKFIENGWLSLNADEKYGGQGLPNVLNTAVSEAWHSANMAFALCPMLTSGAIESIANHASDQIKSLYLSKLVTGEWTGTMNITESDAGSDIAAIKTKATPHDDHYLIKGQKIFISWGDHQMSENIIHLVLARLPDAPVGVKGLSLFVVAKFNLDDSSRNEVNCISVEEKMGIHASPTCMMDFDNAKGYLIGDENKGLSYMFTMMNNARQAVGLQALAISERSYQQASLFSKERLQGTRRDGSRIPIVEHPDVRRMLMTMKSSIAAMRALALYASAEADRTHYAQNDEQRKFHTYRTELFTPIVKAWITELSQEVTSLGLQVHGGMGYVEETGSAQHTRDARILTIYEGTTGIQALDFIGRKTLADKGQQLTLLIEDMQQSLNELKASNIPFDNIKIQFEGSIGFARESLAFLLENNESDKSFAASVSVNFLMLFGYLCGAWMLIKGAIKAQDLLEKKEGDLTFIENQIKITQFYCDHLLPRTYAHYSAVLAGSGSIMSISEDKL